MRKNPYRKIYSPWEVPSSGVGCPVGLHSLSPWRFSLIKLGSTVLKNSYLMLLWGGNCNRFYSFSLNYPINLWQHAIMPKAVYVTSKNKAMSKLMNQVTQYLWNRISQNVVLWGQSLKVLCSEHSWGIK